MAYTQTQLETLEAAIAAAAARVRIGDRDVTYYQLSEMERLRDQMRAELGVSPPTTARGRAWNPVAGHGL